jgi:uncharacterized integral membrane protein (TIGR00697 family)
MDSFLFLFIENMHDISAEYVTLFSIFFSGFAIVLIHRYCGLTGLFIYNVLAVILANIQVLRLSQFSLFASPMALGTVLFSSTFLVNDIINEIYGPNKAKDNVKYCFFASILFSLFMIVDLCHRPSNPHDKAYLAMITLFVPSLRILTSSLIAFFISQWFDVLLFKWLKDYFEGKVLWLRTFIASLFSFLLDNIIFCYLAWSLLSPDPLGAYDIFKTYILGTYITRVLLGIFLIPTIYQCKKHV